MVCAPRPRHVAPFSLFLLLSLSLFVSRAVAATAWDVSARNLVRQLWMSSVIVDDWLYIEGGEYYVAGASSYSDIRYPPTRSIDLSKSWTSSTLIVNQIPKPTSKSNIGHPGLFRQESTNSILVYGGNQYGTASTFSVWGLNVGDKANGGGTWSEVHSTTSSIWQRITWPRLPSFAYTPTGGYALGGYTTLSTRNVLLYEMTVVDTVVNSFEREKEVGVFSSSGGVNQGDGHYVPSFGGLVVFLGGIAYGTDVVGASLRSMSEISVYNPKTKKWFTQSASGDIPSGRKNFCITGAQGTNSSTYEIFVYGGSGLEFFSGANADSRNVYILTLPAFRWIRSTAQTAPRSGSSCQIVKNQMISYGGFDPTGATSFSNQEPWTYGFGIFDITALEWSTNYNADANPYVQSDLVNRFYASNPLYPVWDDNSLAALFSTSTISETTSPSPPKNPNPSETTGTSAPGSTSSTADPNPPASSKTPVAAIAGGVVGGVAVIVALILSIWCIRVRKARKEKERLAMDSSAGISELQNNQTYPELSTERTPEMEGMNPTFYHPMDKPKHDALIKQGPFEVYG